MTLTQISKATSINISKVRYQYYKKIGIFSERAIIAPPSDWPSDDEIDAIFARPARLTDEQVDEMEEDRVGTEYCTNPYMW